jgi:hypothetical protein
VPALHFALACAKPFTPTKTVTRNDCRMDQDVSVFAASTSSPEPGTRGASPRVGFSCKTFVTSESGCFETGTSVSADAELGGSQANHWQPRKGQRMEKGQETWRVGKRLDTAAKRRRASLIFRMFGNLFPLRSTSRAQCACTSEFCERTGSNGGFL